MLSCQNFIPCSLTFCSFNPYLLFKFIILICLLFIHASIHSNLSAGAQNVTAATGAYGAYVVRYRRLRNYALTLFATGAYVIMLVYRCLLTMLQALVNNTLTPITLTLFATGAYVIMLVYKLCDSQ